LFKNNLKSGREKARRRKKKSMEYKPGKVAIIGAGRVGMSTAVALLLNNAATHIYILDKNEDKLKANVTDLKAAEEFYDRCKIFATSNYNDLRMVDITIVCVGCKYTLYSDDEEELVQKNTEAFKEIMPKLNKKGILLIASHPVDVMAWVGWKLSGMDRDKVIGSGLDLATSSYRNIISAELKLSGKSCLGFLQGTLGDDMFPIWAGSQAALTRGGKPPPDFKIWRDRVQNEQEELQRYKGYATSSMGMILCNLCMDIFGDRRITHAVGVLAQGLYGIAEEVFLSFTSIVGAPGISEVLLQNIGGAEVALLKKSAARLNETCQALEI